MSIIRRMFGGSTPEEIERIAKALHSDLAVKTESAWQFPDGLESYLKTFLADNAIRVNAQTRRAVLRSVSEKLTLSLIKRCAETSSTKMRGTRCLNESEFFVHDYMIPCALFEDHGGHLRHPEKDWDFWYAHPHREWVKEMREIDSLVPDFVQRFLTQYDDWIQKGWLNELHRAEEPLRFRLFEVRGVSA